MLIDFLKQNTNLHTPMLSTLLQRKSEKPLPVLIYSVKFYKKINTVRNLYYFLNKGDFTALLDCIDDMVYL
jgi:hypothetical protein